MRSLTDTLTNGPFRDDTHRAAVEAAAVDLAPGQLRGNSPHVPEASAEPVGGVSGGPATHTHAGASEAAQRALQGRMADDIALLDQLLNAQSDRIEADRLWEGDGASSDRTEEAQNRLDRLIDAVRDRMRNGWSEPRARLVPAFTKEGT